MGRRVLLLLCLLLSGAASQAADSTGRKLLYTFPVREQIMPSTVRLTAKCLDEARRMGADAILVRMNTYGGLVDAADSVRSALLDCPVPVWVFIDNQAASAGALIALAADSIYMRPGGSIGAASVVDASGRPMPDKFQSFMRATMRATAEAHGRVVDRIDGTDTLWRWHRDPKIAEAMVGISSGDSTTTGVLTLTAEEAEAAHYSEGRASSVEEVLAAAGASDYAVYEYRPTGMDRLLGWLTNPLVQSIFVMMIVGGIYFELQTPGIGFPLAVALLGTVLYFAPLYVEGLARHWELILFVAGLLLIAVEIFVLPGFGVAGVVGIAAVVTGLACAAVDNELFRHVASGEISPAELLRPFGVVIGGGTAALVVSIWLGRRFLTGSSPLRERIVLTASMAPEEGYTGHPVSLRELVGRTATVASVLRPSGRVVLDGAYYEAVSLDGFYIGRGERVTVVRAEGGLLYCRMQESPDENAPEREEKR
ncbi:NfeD family protein [uncultured Alistipes sp.]|uniref:NfeD family protein n=1 Tax=uncultured Alistipes sp. TaxID=538949 RepID=UPI0026384CDC|nr:NfeD family protein [uncultured Alistipes sp.]